MLETWIQSLAPHTLPGVTSKQHARIVILGTTSLIQRYQSKSEIEFKSIGNSIQTIS